MSVHWVFHAKYRNWVTFGRTLGRLLFPDYPHFQWERERVERGGESGRYEGEEDGRGERDR